MNTGSTYEETAQPVPAFSPETGASLNANRVRQLAVESGFTEAGVVPLPHPADGRNAGYFGDWIREGRAGSMKYLERRDESGRLLRSSPSIPFRWAKSAIVCLANYNSAQPRSTDPAAAGAAWIARYAWSSRTGASGECRPSDYHKVLLKRLRAVEERLHNELGAFESRAYVDTGPVVERSLAVAAGLGWTGKNTCLIHPRQGSYSFLAVLLTALSKQSEKAPEVIEDRCGTCRRCLDACPTQALFAPYQMDATRCISYLTIEHKGPIAEELMAGMGRQVFGCDICQDVCPWNSPRRAPIAVDSELAARPEMINPVLDWLASLDESGFGIHFNGSPVRRAGFAGLRRNMAIAMGNSGLPRFAPTLGRWINSADAALSAAARWALDKLQDQKSAPEKP